VKEMKRESKRKGKIASGLKYYVAFAYGGRFGKTPLMLYIELRSYVQKSVILTSGERPAPFERDIKVRSSYSIPEQGSFIAIKHLRQPRRILLRDTIKGTSWSVKQSYLWPCVSKSDIL
jgi:hypothetical protein